jgi:hypothetical protein
MFTATVTTADVLSFVISAVLPIIVTLVTAREASDGLKSWILIGLSGVNGFLTTWLSAVTSGIPFNIAEAIMTAAIGFATAVIAHQGILLPMRVTGKDGVVARKVPGGLGKPRS